MTRGWLGGLVATLLALIVACDAGGDGDSSATSGSSDSLAQTTPWSVATAGTSQVPAYGNSCRFEADSHIAMPANAASDDSVTLQKSGNSYDLLIELEDGSGGSATLSVSLAQGLSLRSYRNGEGAAQGAGALQELTGAIQDAALCFESKLASAEATRGEFSVVVLNAAGSYVSLGGDFELPGASVFPVSGDDANMVQADSLMVDLQ